MTRDPLEEHLAKEGMQSLPHSPQNGVVVQLTPLHHSILCFLFGESFCVQRLQPLFHYKFFLPLIRLKHIHGLFFQSSFYSNYFPLNEFLPSDSGDVPAFNRR